MSMQIIPIPCEGLTGNVYRGTMPRGMGQEMGRSRLTEQLQKIQINTLLLLCNKEECVRTSGTDLEQFYPSIGIEVISLSIPDFGTPKPEELMRVVVAIHERAMKGLNILVHCQGGIGRTGMVLACLLRKIHRCTGDEAIAMLRKQIPHAVETQAQTELVRNFPLDPVVAVEQTPPPQPKAQPVVVEQPAPQRQPELVVVIVPRNEDDESTSLKDPMKKKSKGCPSLCAIS